MKYFIYELPPIDEFYSCSLISEYFDNILDNEYRYSFSTIGSQTINRSVKVILDCLNHLKCYLREDIMVSFLPKPDEVIPIYFIKIQDKGITFVISSIELKYLKDLTLYPFQKKEIDFSQPIIIQNNKSNDLLNIISPHIMLKMFHIDNLFIKQHFYPSGKLQSISQYFDLRYSIYYAERKDSSLSLKRIQKSLTKEEFYKYFESINKKDLLLVELQKLAIEKI